MRLVQTSTRGENSMDVESLSLLESGSTMPHRGIALPLLTWYLCIYCCCAAAFSIYQRWMTHHSILVQPQHLIFLSINFSLLTYDHRTWWSLSGLLLCVSQLTTNPVASILPEPACCCLSSFAFWFVSAPWEFSFTDVFWPVLQSSSHDSEYVGGGCGEGSAMKQKKWWDDREIN